MRDWEPEFIELWTAGVEASEIARRLGIPLGTVHSRAGRLRREGKVEARPRGGNYPTVRAHARQADASPPVQNPAQRSVHSAVQGLHGAVQVQDSAEPPIPATIATELTRLWAAIEALREDVHRPVQETVQSFPEPMFDDPAENATERWNLYLKRGLRVRIEALAQARGVPPSRVVQEILWQALSDR